MIDHHLSVGPKIDRVFGRRCDTCPRRINKVTRIEQRYGATVVNLCARCVAEAYQKTWKDDDDR